MSDSLDLNCRALATDVLDDPRLAESDAAALEAARAECDGDVSAARALYARASARTAAVALGLSGLPKVRATLAVSSVCLAARAGRYDRAVDLAERFLAEPGALPWAGATELLALLASYRQTLARGRPPRPAPSSRILRTHHGARHRLRGA